MPERGLGEFGDGPLLCVLNQLLLCRAELRAQPRMKVPRKLRVPRLVFGDLREHLSDRGISGLTGDQVCL